MDWKTALEIAGLLFAFAVAFGVFKNTVENLKSENAQQWTVITKCRDWQQIHEKEASERRLEIERQLGKIREDSSKVESQLAELLRLVTKLTERFDKFMDKQD
jgi:Zn-finger protein